LAKLENWEKRLTVFNTQQLTRGDTESYNWAPRLYLRPPRPK